ncbi:hypothetical protein [Haloferula sargassicola]|uniref:Uncharacterized protein n=1 Tax=Haloferula sargassicola TaxID=490096 RepID=A0ABP9UM58_9BACT
MNFIFRLLGGLSCLVCAGLPSAASAQVACWAPGMNAPVTLQEYQRSASVSLGTPYRYQVFGVAGQLELGNRAASATTVDGRFHSKFLGFVDTGHTVDSVAWVCLQTGLVKFYPEVLAITGDTVGAANGPVHIYGERWTLCDPDHQVPVNLAFHLPGSTLLGSVLGAVASPDHYNLNPKGYFYVLGECHFAPPPMTGKLTVSGNTVLYGAGAVIRYRIDRDDPETPYRPPFLGLDLGDVNLIVLGTPPAGASGNGLALPDFDVPELASVTIDLSGPGGPGWSRIER